MNADSITTNAGGTTAINGGSITTTNAQNYNDAITLGSDSSFLTSGGAVNFASTINNATTHALLIDTSFGAITLGSNVGVGTTLGAITLNSFSTTSLNGTINADSITTDSGGTTIINGGTITTTGAQNYNDAVTLGADTIINTTNNLVNFASTIDSGSARAFTINAGSGAITLANNVGSASNLGAITLNSTDVTSIMGTINAASITTNTGGTTAINGGNITTSGTQTYNDVVSLGASTTLASAGITLSDVVGGGQSLILSDSSTSMLTGAISGVDTLQTDAVNFNNASITTTGNQTYNGIATLVTTTSLSSDAGNIAFNNNLNGGAQSLSLTGGAGGDHVFTLNDVNSLGTLSVNGSSSVANTLALLTNNGTTTWTLTSANGGTIAATDIANGGFSNIQNLVGGTANNNFAFNNGASLSGSITGGGIGTNNTLNISGYLTPVTIDTSGSTAPGIIGGSFNNIYNLIGSDSGSTSRNSLIGLGNTTITSHNTGTTTSGYSFTGFGNLGGGSGNTRFTFSANANLTGNITDTTGNNRYIFGNGASIGGNIVGSGTDRIDASAYTTSVTVNLAGSSSFISGSIAGVNLVLGPSGGAGGSSTLQGPGSNNTWNFTTGTTNAGNINGTISFNNFGNVVAGSGTESFIFQNNANISGNLTGGGSSTLNTSAFSASNVNIQTHVANGIGGVFSGISNFIGSGSTSSIVGQDNSTWTITGNNLGTVNSNTFTGFGNLGNSAGINAYIINGGSIDGTITGGSGVNTLTIANGNTNWVINTANSGTVTGVGGGFSNIQNITGSNNGTNYFTFTNNGYVSGLINGGNTTHMNTVDFNSYNYPITLTLTIPASGDEFNSGTLNNTINTNSFTQIQQAIGPNTETNILNLPNKANTTIVYTNPTQTSGYIGDPFYFTNFVLQQNIPPTPPTPVPLQPTQPTIPTDIAQIITPFNQDSANNTPYSPSLISDGIINQNIDQIINQQSAIDTEIGDNLAVGCYQLQ